MNITAEPIDPKLPDVEYLRFPFKITAHGAATSAHIEHVREQIEQILFTTPGERVFRPEFGAGIRRLIFEPNNEALAGLVTRRLQSSLQPALQGEVDPKSLTVNVRADPAAQEQLIVEISYTLAAIGHRETVSATLGVST